MLRVEWAADQQSPLVEVTAQVQAQDRALVPGQGNAAPLSDAERKLNLAATELLPTDGLVRDTAQDIVKGKQGDVAKARAIYEWVVENTFRNAKTLGCGVGDITTMIRTGNLNGKCADLNALFVGLARSVGLPARDVYGIRVVPSQFGFKALGAGSENITKAQHCRAEVWLPGSGWTPVDPADVRKVVLEEPPGNLAMNDPKVAGRAQGAVRLVGGQLGRLQHGTRREAAGLEGGGHPLPDVPAGREQGRVPRFARSRQVQVPHHRA